MAGVVGRGKKPAPGGLAGRYSAWAVGGDDSTVENLGSTVGVSGWVLIVPHPLLRGPMGEPE